MDAQKLNTWVQSLTAVAILIGLGLVVWELQQAKTLARLQLTSDGFSHQVEYNAALLGENPNSVLTKACIEPEALSYEDVSLLNRYFFGRLQNVFRAVTLERIGTLGSDWEGVAFPDFAAIFDNEFGRKWWKTNSELIPQDVKIAGDRVLEQYFTHCKTYLDSLHPPLANTD